VYEWVSHWRVDNTPNEPARWVKVAGFVALIILTYFLVSNYRQLLKFVTIRPGSMSSQIAMQTTGIHWDKPEVMARNLLLQSEISYSLSANDLGWASAVYTVNENGTSEVVYSYQIFSEDGTEYSWSNPISVSISPEINSINPQITTDNFGVNHIVWTEEVDPADEVSDIYYSRCETDSCSAPILLSNLSGLVCEDNADTAITSINDWPVIAQDDENTTMVIWSNSNNKLIFSTWSDGQRPPGNPSGCLPGLNLSGNPLNVLQSRVVGGVAEHFSSVFSILDTGEETVYAADFQGRDWSNPRSQAIGTTPNVFSDSEGKIFYTWCDESDLVQVKDAETDLIQTIDFPPCDSRPYFAQDDSGNLHLSWYSGKVRNNENVVSSADIVYESIHSDQGWSEPAIIAQTEGFTSPVIAGRGGGYLNLLWNDDGGNILRTAVQPVYSCSEDDLGRIGQVMLSAAENGDYRPEGDMIPYCGNSYVGLIYMPNPEPAYSPQNATANGGFDTVSDIADNTQYEVLFSVMEWGRDDEETGLNPGSVYTQEIANLYQRIRNDPSSFPRGLTIRILLGNYPELSNLEWGEQIWGVINDLRLAGVDKMVDAEIGWKVEIANFEGTFPHSHTKFMIIDGRVAVASGYNYGYLHFPFDHPSNKGGDLFDLGIVLSGPIAQQVLVTYDDYWDGAEQVHCPNLPADPGYFWTQSCTHTTAKATHVPEVMKYFMTDGSANAFSLNRNLNNKESDEVILEALSSAEETLDILEVNFSLELICILDNLNDDICTYENSLDYMQAIMSSVEQNQTKVRVLVEKLNSNGLENRVTAKEFTRELEERGLDEFVEIKFFEGRMHAKAFLIDDEMLFVGSQNFHYSAWGEGGLAEYNLATDDPRAVETFKGMFDYYWESGIPWEEYN
jgi:phosphatidylserine/phosphatidylglycerophosphate/cardiolipin synthase-like enzyme